MITGTLKVEPAKLKNAANQFNSTGNQIRSLTQSMTQTVEQMTGQVWSGDAARAYTTKFKGLQDDIQKMIKMVNEHVADLNQMAQILIDVENKNQQTANSLKNNIIS